MNDSNKKVVDEYVDSSMPWKTNMITLALALSNAADAVEIICVGFIMMNYNGVTSLEKEWLSSAVFIGMLFGGIASGYLSDIIGRKPCLMMSLGLNSLAGLASAITPSISWLIVCRIFAGLGIGGSVPVVFSLGAELFPSHIRGKHLSMIASFWMVGAIYSAGTAWIMLSGDVLTGLSWRSYAVVSVLPAIAAFCMAYSELMESPRYLLSHHRYEETAAVLSCLSGQPVNRDVFQTVGEISEESMDQSAVFDGKSSGESSSIMSYLKQLFSKMSKSESTTMFLFSPSLRFTTINLIIVWFTLSFGSYGLATWISVLFEDIGVGNAYAESFIFALANIPGNYVSVFYVEQIGRKRLLSYGMFFAGISGLAFACDTKSAVVVVLFSFLFNAFSVMGWNSLDILSVENFPTTVRTSAMGLLAASGRLGSISAQFVNGSLEQNVPLLLFVTSGCTFLGALVAFFLPNDRTGESLLESAADTFDNCANSTKSKSQAYTLIADSTVSSPLEQ